METTRVYAVDRVYDDLKTPFVAKDIIKQLSQLDIVVGDIFNRVSLKVLHEKARVATINDRLRVCQAKVNAITARRTSNKPTTVFSTSKYPAPKVLPPTRTLFYDKPYAETPVVVPDTDDDAHFLPAEPLVGTQRAKVVSDVLELFERVNPYCERTNGEVDMSKEGLGRLPEYIPSIGSVLLFNSGENPYQKYTSWDNLLGVDYEEEEEERKQLASAPKTLVDGDQLPAVHGENVDFRPTMGVVEDLSAQLPTNLPLENIAEYSYTASAEARVSIAPSLFQDKTLPDLPPLESFANAPSVQEPSQTSGPIGPGDEPPPPPPPPPAAVFAQDDDNEPPPPPPPQAADDDAPPPPPQDDDDAPPPPPQEGGIPNDLPSEQKNPGASLMDQIRNPSLRLRKVTAHETQADPLDKSGAGNKPLSIADEIKQRMLRRQAAISGKQDQLEQKRERERMTKPVEVLKAQEVTRPSEPSPPPPPPPPASDTRRRSQLPTVEMSDDGSDGAADQVSDNGSNEENDFLLQIRNIRNKQEQQSPRQRAAKRPVPTLQPEAPKNPLVDFESQMRGLRNREESLSLSEGSDWSDE